jgi:uncharacterized protein (TIGR03435 family)
MHRRFRINTRKETGIMMRTFAGIGFLAFVSSAVFGQSPPAPPAFEIADVHSSPHTTTPFFQGGALHGDRYIARNATMVDLIATAYGIENDKVLGGPSWLETDRFDVIAKVAPSTPPETLKLMLQALLSDRFKLVMHSDQKSMPGFVLAVGKNKPKLKESAGSDNTGCQISVDPPNPSPGVIPFLVDKCRNITMEAFALHLRQVAGGYVTSTLLDSTGLKGAWDFDFKWSPPGALAQAGADGISLFDAMDKQLGLKIEPQKAAMPVVVVDAVNEKPTDNPPGVKTTLPPPAPAEFEVAVIKPSLPDANLGGRIDGGQISLQGITLKFLISFAWNINPNADEMLVGAPKWLNTDKFDILAKTNTDAPASGQPNTPQVDIDDLRSMLRALLIDRFKMAVHMEDRPVSAYTLTAANPKLKQADPMNRTGCKEGPGPDGKDPRIANPILNRLVTCQNMTMAQFADRLQSLAPGYIYTPVLDATGLEGAWDFTISFSGVGQGGRGAQSGGDAAPPPAGGAPIASDPSGALPLPDAISKQLGLKLEKQKRPVSVLVIDHVDQKPTEN